ncbi:MAG TPA: zinc ribbon domain-containing protein [Anaerolineae bacterium]|nr:zinc ribbon domain-containing protein [Anaerolineae bacterium]
MKVNVTVYGQAPDVWQSLLGTLYAHEYKIESQSPYTTLTASRGNKTLIQFLVTTKGGYRDLVVTLTPKGGNAIAVQFNFRFPMVTTVYEGTMKDCREMVAQFAAAAAQPGAAPAPPTPGVQAASSPPPAAAAATGYAPPPAPGRVDVSGATCKACGAVVGPGARFCHGCGASLAAAATCPKCGAPLIPGGSFCEKCGARVTP